MGSPQFEVVIQGSRISPGDLLRAMSARASDLPKHTEEQKRAARRLGGGLLEYARRELAELYAKERMRGRAQRIGRAAAQILQERGHDYRLLGVVADMAKDRWILTIKTPGGKANVAVPRELADEVVDWGFREKMEELKQRVLYGIGLESIEARPHK
jgi:hypothetical protein